MAELGRMERNGLIAGDFPTKAQEITVTGPAEFLRGDVVGITDDGVYALVDSTKTDGTQIPIGVICDSITIEDGLKAVSNLYVKGEFARRFLRFGGSDTADTHMRRMTEIGLLIRDTKAEGGSQSWQ